ncbi:sensor histidine kinase [Ruminococcus flavefaciens]|nr:HAMP domain-containing sensor histidine kinase [Ruminococcus flavefaciens]
MIKRLLRRRKQRRPKRTSFWRMFAVGMILPVLITVILGNYSSYFIKQTAFTNEYNQAENFISEYQRLYKSNKPQRVPEELFLSMYGCPEADLVGGRIDPKTWVEPTCSSFSFTFDKDGNIIGSSRAKIGIALKMSQDLKSSQWYYYDPQDFHIPELDELISEVIEYRDKPKQEYFYELDITELYINVKEAKMIPHVTNVRRYYADDRLFGEYYGFTSELESEYTLTTDFEAEDYVLTKVFSRNDRGGNYPCGSTQGVFGCDPEVFDKLSAEQQDRLREFLEKETSKSIYSGGNYTTQSTDVIIQRFYDSVAAEGILVYAETNIHGFRAWRRLLFMIGLLFGLMTLFVFVLCFSKNAKNKARYAFEDYQRALTNNLAHDIKTPLAVIGGYAENLLEMRRDSAGEKELKYISSIMDNVAYTDEIVRKTLKLSETESVKRPHKKKTDIKALAEKLADKYLAAIEERGIEFSVSGGGEINADEDILSTAVENLISNAVKYTRSDGTIKITADKKRLCVINDVSEDIDTKELMMPFVKGDKVRGDKSSSGLGLAIAAAAAERNGFELKIGCRDKRFKAEIIF